MILILSHDRQAYTPILSILRNLKIRIGYKQTEIQEIDKILTSDISQESLIKFGELASKQHEPWGIRSQRLIPLLPRLIPSILKVTHIIILKRDPGEIIELLAAEHKINIDGAEAMFVKDELDTKVFLDNQGFSIPKLLIEYDELQEQKELIYKITNFLEIQQDSILKIDNQIARKTSNIKSTQKCRHLGPPTGETRPCVVCSGKVEVPIHYCEEFGRCTENKVVTLGDDKGNRPVQCCSAMCPKEELITIEVKKNIWISGTIGNSRSPYQNIPNNKKREIETFPGDLIGSHVRIKVDKIESKLLAVRVRLQHPWIGDLAITLTSPDHQIHTLMNKVSDESASGDGLRVIFHNFAPEKIGDARLTDKMIRGPYRPQSLLPYKASTMNGEWLVSVYDTNTGETGVIELVEILFGETFENPTTYNCIDGQCKPINGEEGEYLDPEECIANCK